MTSAAGPARRAAEGAERHRRRRSAAGAQGGAAVGDRRHHHLLGPDAGRQPVHPLHRRARLLSRLPEEAAQHGGASSCATARRGWPPCARSATSTSNMTTYFGTFTIVNFCLGVVTVVPDLAAWACPIPLLWGVLAAVLNYIPYIGPAIVTGTLGVVGPADLSDAWARPLVAPLDLSRHRHRRGAVPDAGADGAPARAQSVRGLPRHRLLHLAVGTVRRLPGRAAADGADRGARSRLRRGRSPSCRNEPIARRRALSLHETALA